MDLTGVLVSVIVAGLVYVFWQNRRPACLPPGPAHIPFIGSIFSFTQTDIGKQIQCWRKRYGDIFTFSLGNKQHVVLSGYDVVKEAFITNAIAFAGRPPVTIIGRTVNRYLPVRGIASNTFTEEWKRQRSTSLHILRDLGYGKNSIDAKIQEECEYLKEIFQRTESQPTDPMPFLNISICNIICSFLFGERYDHANEEFATLMDNFNKMIGMFFKKGLETSIPILQLLPSFKRHLSTIQYHNYRLSDFFDMKINERLQRLEESNYSDPEDFIEHYLVKIRNVKEGNMSSYDITEDWINRIVNDFFVAGTDTTSSGLCWALLRMALHGDKQRRLQEELDAFSGAVPCQFHFSDREKLPYLEATTLEVLRISTVGDTSLVHTTTCDVQIRGYTIPEGTFVHANLLSVLKDDKLWPEPEEFRPERFINEDGTVSRPEYWIPFSLGRRVCMGEQLARHEMFAFLGMLVHTFDISIPDGAPTPSTEGIREFTMKPAPYKICFKPRL